LKAILYLTLIVANLGCGSSKEVSRANMSKRGNNQVIVQGELINSSEGGQDKVIFEGYNNTVILEYLNAFFNSENSRDVIIVEGNGNTFKLSHKNMVDNSIGSADTIYLKGDENHIELLQSYFINNSENKGLKTEYIGDNQYWIIDADSSAEMNSLERVENKFTKEWVPVTQAFEFYQKEAISGNMTATFYLGEMYQLGVAGDVDILKAEYYYLISAKSGYRNAQSALGYIYENNWLGLRKDLEKAKYWYRKAANQNDEFAKDRLKNMEF
jgi:TPR repeat protein